MHTVQTETMPDTWKTVGKVDFTKNLESGVDMAFDALMNLEQNKDVSLFMRDYQDTGEGEADPGRPSDTSM